MFKRKVMNGQTSPTASLGHRRYDRTPCARFQPLAHRHALMPVGEQRPGSITAQLGRGRSAAAPSELPPRGWKDILLRIWEEHR
jgi:hypothetical protein